MPGKRKNRPFRIIERERATPRSLYSFTLETPFLNFGYTGFTREHCIEGILSEYLFRRNIQRQGIDLWKCSTIAHLIKGEKLVENSQTLEFVEDFGFLARFKNLDGIDGVDVFFPRYFIIGRQKPDMPWRIFRRKGE